MGIWGCCGAAHEEKLVTEAVCQGNVERVSATAAGASLLGAPSAGKESWLSDVKGDLEAHRQALCQGELPRGAQAREEESDASTTHRSDGVGRVERLCHAVAVVHVHVDVQRAPPPAREAEERKHSVVDVAEPGGGASAGVVAPSVEVDGGAAAAGGESVRGLQGAACGRTPLSVGGERAVRTVLRRVRAERLSPATRRAYSRAPLNGGQSSARPADWSSSAESA